MTANTSPQVYEQNVRQVAGCVVLAPALRSPPLDGIPEYSYHVLLISSRADPNRWILPKGGYEVKDGPEPRNAALRETWEEAGVKLAIPSQAHLLGTVEHTPKSKPNKPQRFWWYSYLGAGTQVAPLTPTAIGEVLNSNGEAMVLECAPGPEWPEHDVRRRQWFPIGEAMRVLSNKHMVRALEMAIERYGLVVEDRPVPMKNTIIPVFAAKVV
jgi:8-oxo-dGTP pyrophosphatase MutT (NUDIX family)